MDRAKVMGGSRAVNAVTPLLMVMAFQSVQAQPVSGSLFPYAPGDSAVFNISYPGTHSVWVSGEYGYENHTYVIVQGIQGRRTPDTLRADGDRVFRLENGFEYVLYDFSLPDGATYLVKEGAIPDTFHVTVERRASEDVPVGVFHDCVRLWFDIPLAVDDEWLYAFCPEVGLVWHSGAWGGGILEWAFIGGKVITEVEHPEESTSRFHLYPNPVWDAFFIDVRRGLPEPATIAIHDVTGRMIARQYETECCTEVRVDAAGWTAGLYVVRVRGRNMDEAHPVVVLP